MRKEREGRRGREREVGRREGNSRQEGGMAFSYSEGNCHTAVPCKRTGPNYSSWEFAVPCSD